MNSAPGRLPARHPQEAELHLEPRRHSLSPKHQAQRLPTGLKVGVRDAFGVLSACVEAGAWGRETGAWSAKGRQGRWLSQRDWADGYLSEKLPIGAEKPEVAL